MDRTRNSLGWVGAAIVAVALLAWSPDHLNAATVVFRNECRTPIIVQASTVIRGVRKREQPYLLKFGETTPRLIITTSKIITIYDGKSNKVLFHDVLKASPKPLYYRIIPDPRTGKVRMMAPAKTATTTTVPATTTKKTIALPSTGPTKRD